MRGALPGTVTCGECGADSVVRGFFDPDGCEWAREYVHYWEQYEEMMDEAGVKFGDYCTGCHQWQLLIATRFRPTVS
jgi:hypothetical protein